MSHDQPNGDSGRPTISQLVPLSRRAVILAIAVAVAKAKVKPSEATDWTVVTLSDGALD